MNSASIRGCSWCNFASRLRAFDRDSYSSDYWGFNQGFRVACEAPECQILRGGSWSSYPFHIHASLRFRIVPDLQDLNIGFRVSCEEVE